MIRKFFLAASALVFFTAVAVSSASAEVNVDVNLNLGGGYPSYYPESYPVYPPYPVTDENYDDYDNADCGYERTYSNPDAIPDDTGHNHAEQTCADENSGAA